MSNTILPTFDTDEPWYYPYWPYTLTHISRSTVTKSMRIGFGQSFEGRPVRVYQAHDRLCCAACGREMAPGELFTRRVVAGSPDRQRSHPHCRSCAPFDPPPHGGRPE